MHDLASAAHAHHGLAHRTHPDPATRIHPFQIGRFVEHLGDLAPAMWAEKLSDGAFLGLSTCTFAHIAERGFQERPRYPRAAANRAEIARELGARQLR